MKYFEDYNSLVSKLNSAPYFYFKNYSVPQSDPLRVKTAYQLSKELEEQIRPCSIVLIIAGMYVNYRNWIQKEIEIAESLRKPILVLRPFGAERIPLELQKYQMAYWNIDSIVEAIKKYAI